MTPTKKIVSQTPSKPLSDDGVTPTVKASAQTPKKRLGFLVRDGFSFPTSADRLYRVCISIKGSDAPRMTEPVGADEAIQAAKATRQAISGNKKYGRVYIAPNLPPARRTVVSSEKKEDHFEDTLNCGHKKRRNKDRVYPFRYCRACSSMTIEDRKALFAAIKQQGVA